MPRFYSNSKTGEKRFRKVEVICCENVHTGAVCG
jgi:hypothetical protein